MAYPTSPANGDKVGANLVPRPSFPDTALGGWVNGDVAPRTIATGVTANRMALTDSVAYIKLPEVPFAAATFKASILYIATSGNPAQLGLRGTGLTGTFTDWVTLPSTNGAYLWRDVTISFAARGSAPYLELTLEGSAGQNGFVQVRLDYADSPVTGYFDGSTADTANYDFGWNGTAFASTSKASAIVTNPSGAGTLSVPVTLSGAAVLPVPASGALSVPVTLSGFGVDHEPGTSGGTLSVHVTLAGTAVLPAIGAGPLRVPVALAGTAVAVEPVPTLADRVVAFLEQTDNPEVIELADTYTPVITSMVRAYTRGRGFVDGQPCEELVAVITTAAARLVANPEQVAYQVGATNIQGGFHGWTLAETFVLNRYRKRAA